MSPRLAPSPRVRGWSARLLGVEGRGVEMMARAGINALVAIVVQALPLQPAGAQAPTVSGSVVSLGGAPIADVLVSLIPRLGGLQPGPVQRTVTDPSGHFDFAVAIDGDYLLRAERLGFATFTSEPLALRRGDPVTVRVTLDVEPVALEPLEITASSRPWWEVLQPAGLWPFFDRMERYEMEGRGRFFTAREVERWRGIPVASALSAVLPYLRTEQAPGRFGQVVLRGPGRCEPIVFVNGSFVELAPKGPGGGVIEYIPIDVVVDAHSLVAVESYRGMSQAPAELQTIRRGVNPNCTVLGLWTLRR